ncbi:GTPase-activating protein BEM3 NDAI_0E02490 [Naumovozyma dairenensis CBS 421]|uniref:Rho-GAP domain-containing protein n=1 Tax=Naumovozyma dairenensis (strain ATCC 10597 / BCRC 20456 / CBS 421 / NBRC 0211 / NRRL Y-12639) TaxID=1071378 RepID=G0WBE6_NAUDC|nr:hypothetical protein NDAI_0E02490 [Naumovozyma dairenensis CBS 421]CCD25066.1 hypothetical protein NDAI_0E02490 [Naumovozyma dairenensis CBS 421]
MSEQPNGSATLELLAQYDNHISERDKTIEYIERTTDPTNDNKPTYDELFKENVKLKLLVQEYETEIDSLKKTISLLRENRKSVNSESLDVILDQSSSISKDSDATRQSLTLPPRSDRRSNTKNLSIPIPQSTSTSSQLDSAQKPQVDIITTTTNNDSHHNTKLLNAARFISSPHKITKLQESLSSPATSVTYTTSRITIKSPRNSVESPLQNKMGSPQNPNRVTSVINNHIHSPLRGNSQFSTDDLNNGAFKEEILDTRRTLSNEVISSVRSPSTYSDSKSPLAHLRRSTSSGKKSMEFSPNSKAKLNNFAQLLDTSFGEEEEAEMEEAKEEKERLKEHEELVGTAPLLPKENNDDQPLPKNLEKDLETNNSVNPYRDGKPQLSRISAPVLTPVSEKHINMTPTFNRLGSPLILNRKTNMINGTPSSNNTTGTSPRQGFSNFSISEGTEDTNASTISSSTKKQNILNDLLHVKISSHHSDSNASTPNTTEDTASNQTLSVQQEKSKTENVRSVSDTASSLKSDIPLFVQPTELFTVRIEILSTLYNENKEEHDLNRYEENYILFGIIDKNTGKEMFKFSKTINKVRELDVYLKSHLTSNKLVTIPNLPDRSFFNSNLPIRIDQRREILNKYFESLFDAVPKLPPNVSLKIAQFISTDTAMNPLDLGDTIKEGYLLIRKPKTLSNANNWKTRYCILTENTLQFFNKGQLFETIRLKGAMMELLPNLPDDKYGTKNGFLINEHRKSGLSSTTKYFLCTETSKERELWISAISQFLENSFSLNIAERRLSTGSDRLYVTDLTSEVTSNSTESNTGISSQTATYEPFLESIEDDKEVRRNKKRSFFPFKKLTGIDYDNIPPHDLELKSPTKSSVRSVDLNNQTLVPSISGTNSHSYMPQSATVFGSSLNDCLKLSSHTYQRKYEIPSVVYRCLEYLYKNRGVQEEGIFRLSGSSTLIKTLQEKFDQEYDIDLCQYNETIADPNGDEVSTLVSVNTISGLLKLYLRKLPHMIFGDEQYLPLKKIIDDNHDDPLNTALQLREVVANGEIPKENLSLMYALFELLVKINANNKLNKMNVRNLCIVFSPTLNIPITLLQPFIVDFACIFQGAEPIDGSQREQLDINIPQL